MLSYADRIEERSLTDLKPFAGNARTHSKSQIKQIADSMKRFGFNNPILLSEDGTVIAGHGRLEAARLLGLSRVPTICLAHLSEAERRAYTIADNKIALNAGWDIPTLTFEVGELQDLGFDLELTGFSMPELDIIFDEENHHDEAAEEPPRHPPEEPVSQPGDLWLIGDHRMLCGDAREAASYKALLEGEAADLIFTDPPYNLSPAERGVAQVQHPQFQMAAGELSRVEFTHFLTTCLGNAAEHARDGSIAYVCMDWRHMGELLAAGEQVFTDLKNVCVWNKASAGMGKFYRSKHEFVFVYKKGNVPHINNFGMGGSGRYRTNVWDYAGVSGFKAGREDELAMHPTVKPVAMVKDALLDCSNRGDAILDPFGGSGTTLVAAQQSGRRARVIEIDPAYCDVIIERAQSACGLPARLGGADMTYAEVREQRLSICGESGDEQW